MSPRPWHRVRVSTPGRVCLFGEHQDYLGLPVVPCAISLRVEIEACHRDDDLAVIHLPDIGSRQEFSLCGDIPYVSERDYFRSAVNVMRREGFAFPRGLECTVRGEIPINAGTSSSSALVVAWVHLLSLMYVRLGYRVGTDTLTAEDTARIAHAAEVLEFGEPGGMMDHYATVCGGANVVEFEPETRVYPLPDIPGAFVLGDSREPKDTKGVLSRVKGGVLRAVEKLRAHAPCFSLHAASISDVETAGEALAPDERALLLGTIRNRDIAREAVRLLSSAKPDYREMGRLLDLHQDILRDSLGISTPKIDSMLRAAKAAGAWGGKINGSGGGGCMFAYAPDDPGAVAEAVGREGGKAYVVRADEGTRVETRTGPTPHSRKIIPVFRNIALKPCRDQ